jgi:hypothetical protein
MACGFKLRIAMNLCKDLDDSFQNGTGETAAEPSSGINT